mmetsp:Transcript_32396/g.100247  ORF Transcript_32396/g.100247 Transcript_32396/m.100247 type:complete len:362 (+) Transcript_32396:214-1299(+)
MSALQLPALTVHDEKIIVSSVSFVAWPGFLGLTTCVFETSSDSPVRSISLTFRSALSQTRQSAGTTSPTLSNTRSPTTSAADSTSDSWPSRTTRDAGADSASSASSAPFAAFSVDAAMPALRNTMMKMAMASTYDSALPRRSEFVAEMTADAMAAPRSSTMMSCVSWMRNRTKNVTRGGFSSSLGPSSSRRLAARADVMPFARSESICAASFATSMLCTSSPFSSPSSASSCILARFTRFSAELTVKMRSVDFSKRWRWRSFSTSASGSSFENAFFKPAPVRMPPGPTMLYASTGPVPSRASAMCASNSARVMCSAPSAKDFVDMLDRFESVAFLASLAPRASPPNHGLLPAPSPPILLAL